MEVTNYSGRSVDLFIFQGAKSSGEQPINIGFGSGMVTAGPQKLCQLFAYYFLTELGSIPLYPEVGTSFIDTMRQGKIRDESDIKAAFSLAADIVKDSIIKSTRGKTIPADETINTISLLSATIDDAAGRISLYVEITSAAGSSFNILVPVAIPIH